MTTHPPQLRYVICERPLTYFSSIFSTISVHFVACTTCIKMPLKWGKGSGRLSKFLHQLSPSGLNTYKILLVILVLHSSLKWPFLKLDTPNYVNSIKDCCSSTLRDEGGKCKDKNLRYKILGSNIQNMLLNTYHITCRAPKRLHFVCFFGLISAVVLILKPSSTQLQCCAKCI